MGDQILNSPYRFRMNINESVFLCTTNPLSEHEVKLLKQRTRDLYQVNMILDDLPAMRFTQENGIKIQWTGFPVGYTPPNSDEDYIINHLKFRVLVNEYEGAGVLIIGTGEEHMGVIPEADKKKASGYEMVLRLSPAVSNMIPKRRQNSIFRSDLTMYEELDKKAQVQMNKQLSSWRLVVGDVFREPNHSKLLCVMIGDGVQITGTAVVTIVFAAFGFMSPASRGMLLTGMIIFYLFLGTIAGYAGVRLWITIKGTSDGWRSVTWSVACFFPGICFVILTLQNFVLWDSKSTVAIPISLYFVLLSLWFCISVPLTLVGGFLGTQAEPIQYPRRTSKIPREIPTCKYPSWLLVLGAGTLPFGTIFIELLFILCSIWFGRFYYVFGFLLVVFLLLVIICAEVSVVLTYMHLCVEDWQWWWKAFYASGSIALYVFLYSINYLIFNLQGLNGCASAILYLGYSLIMAIAIMISTGTIGFLTSLYFVQYLYSSVEIDSKCIFAKSHGPV
ncbi:Transmembrane 9 superfamily member 12 [Camellia lanceoleosa]|uniref:Transmembrane 9 superfamily member 12 n=1 Tax=Camellia lanceoleosa TaxID=1840588 RepID=A0ACC0H1U0_9ERIC|nr:Transmembrane 9 superfamily member 12 [Camellia lanceoleosa]